MAFLNSIRSNNVNLRPTSTLVRDAAGGISYERRSAIDGEFEVFRQNSSQGENTKLFMVVDDSPDDLLHSPFPHLFLSSQDGAANLPELRRHSISHILNVATGIREIFRENFTYLSIKTLDLPSENLTQSFTLANEFISKALKSGGNVLIHW